MTIRWLAAASLVSALFVAGGGGCGDEFTLAAGGSGGSGNGGGTGGTGGTGAAGGGSPGSGGTGGGVVEGCQKAADCPGEDTACRSRTCEGGVCGVLDVQQGTPIAGQQIEGDCKLRVCDGAGSTGFVNQDSDLPLEDGFECTEEVCQGGIPSHPPSPTGSSCSEGGGHVCSSTGTCVECLVNGDCEGSVCQAQQCVPFTCTNSVKDGDETDVDCGGSCGGCPNNELCEKGDDCLSGYCLNFVCSPCLQNSMCPMAEFCSSGVCTPDKPVGQPCAVNQECTTGQCADGVCCDFDCSAGCSACSVQKKGMGVDGVCGPVAEGLDPDNECTAEAPCASDGACDGAAGCRKHAAGTPCGQTCSGEVLETYSCDGVGNCDVVTNTSCAPYDCGNNACLGECNNDADCAQGHFCSEQVCGEQLPDGAQCTSDVQCASKGCCPNISQFLYCGHCCNGVQDGGETGVDCGGPCPSGVCGGS